jgi:hypothetical protein
VTKYQAVQPLVLIAANPYEGELCRRALRDTGIDVELCESIEGTMRRIVERRPLCVLIADGWVGADARELLVEVRSESDRIAIFLVEPPGSDIGDEETAVRRGARRLFLRPIDDERLADAIEKLAVDAELAAEVGAQLDGQRGAQPAGGALVPVMEIDAEPSRGNSGEWQPLTLPRVPTERVVAETPAPPRDEPLGLPPPSAALPRNDALSLMRADALADDFVLKVESQEPPKRSGPGRRLDLELSEAERRLFPDSARSQAAYSDEDDALGDIDLDKLSLDTMPDLSTEAEMIEEPAPRNGTLHALAAEEPEPAPRMVPPKATPEEGSLADEDIAELLGALHTMGFSGRLALRRGDAEKAIYLDAGAPVFATSTLVHDRLGDLLFREGKVTREQHARTRELATPPGRRSAQALVELGAIKSNEIFPTLRRHVEDILYSCFSWDSGTFRLGPEQPAAEDKLRLSQSPGALLLEGIRRKYGLERLVERVGPSETVLVPTTGLGELRAGGGLSDSERVASELFDGERALGDVLLALAGMPSVALGETGLYALAWGLLCAGAARRADDPTDRLGIPSVSTLVTGDRRTTARDGERDGDRTIDRDRLLAKRAQLADADYFGVLGVDRKASPHEIERAWDRLRSDFAPERFSESLRGELADALSEIREVLDEAHRVLMDDTVREAYRSNLVE